MLFSSTLLLQQYVHTQVVPGLTQQCQPAKVNHAQAGETCARGSLLAPLMYGLGGSQVVPRLSWSVAAPPDCVRAKTADQSARRRSSDDDVKE